MTTWLDLARGIPVPLGASCHAWSDVDPPGPGKWMPGRVCESDYPGLVGVMHRTRPVLVGHFRAANVVPALDDPDEQAAHLRRLAAALGCPEDIAEDGVVVYMGRDGWNIGAGAFDVDPNEATNQLRWQSLRWVHGDGQPRPIASGDLSRVEVLALAWPQDKRVTS